MYKLSVLSLLILFSTQVSAHGGVKHDVELKNNMKRLEATQRAYYALITDDERLASLGSQIRFLEANTLALQNMLAREYPQAKENVSRYKVDYIVEIKDNLDKIKLLLKQAKELNK